MPSYFNGGSPNFLGQLFTSSSELLTLIRNNLLTENWVTHNNQISGGNFVIMRGQTTNNHNCWVRFSTSVVSAGVQERLTVQGDLDGNNTTLSASGVTLNYRPGANNYLYLSCDNDSGCLCIFPDPALTVRSCHFGFVDRIDITDQWAWYVGDFDVTGLNNKYAARSRHNLTNWRQISDDFSGSTGFSTLNSSTASPPLQGIWDRYTISQFSAHSPIFSGIGSTNAAYLAYNGRTNPITNLPILDSYFYIEGRGSNTAYGSGMTGGLHYRGDIKHAVTGVASYNGGVQLLTIDGQRYLSGGTQGWQGFRIG